jgi:membrane protease subunit HflK
VDVKSLRKIEIGFRTTTPGRYADVDKEALMMTGDNNFADVESAVQYRVKDPILYGFNVKDPDLIVKYVSEAMIRERVAQRTISQVLTSDRDIIVIEAKQGIQNVLDQYGIGVKIENVRLQEVNPPDQVLSAFDDVNSALQDKEKIMNEAKQYYNDLVPRAQGEASETVQNATAYKEIQILNAQGEVARFNSILQKYKEAPEITRTRLYIETMEEILPGAKKILLFNEQNDTLNFLDLEKTFQAGDSE